MGNFKGMLQGITKVIVTSYNDLTDTAINISSDKAWQSANRFNGKS